MYSTLMRLPTMFLTLLFLSSALFVACSPVETSTKCQKDKDCKDTELCQKGVCASRQRCSAATASVVCKPTETCKNSICMPKQTTPPRSECQTDLDCSDNKRCNAALGKCVECIDDSNCTNGKVCRGNVCTDGSSGGEQTPDQDNRTKCSSDADCLALENHTCDLIEGVCAPRGGKSCSKDDDCPGNQRCESETCTIGRRDCSSNPSACQAGYECRANNCYRKSCKDNNDCETDKTCDKATAKCGGATSEDCTKTGCPAGKTCNRQSKRCQDSSLGCSSDAECKPDEKCNTFSGKCEPKTGGCTSNSDCQSNEQCTNRKCVPKTGGCTSSSDCKSNETCSGGKCIPRTSSCTKDGDCPSGTKCFSGNCRVGCRTNSDCASGQKCNLGTNRCETSSCTSDSQCNPPVGACYQGKCQSCASQFNCPSNANCNFSTGRCESKPATCTSNSQCSSPNGWCQGGNCVSCTTVSCPTGQTCNRTTGRCRSSGCTTNSDCRITQYCSVGRCLAKQCDTALGLNCPSGQRCVNYTCSGTSSNTRARCSGIMKSCPTGQTCLTTSKGDYCYKTCFNNGGKCSDGNDCIEVTLGSGSKRSFCFFPPSKSTGEACEDLDTRCKTGSFCIFDSRAATSGRCWKQCPSASSTTCGTGNVCSPVSDTEFACLQKGSGVENSTCRTTSVRCGESFFCYMATDTSSTGKCIPRCSGPGSRSTCKTGFECLALYANSTSKGICLPAASRNVGQSCGGSTGQRCKSGLTCTLLSQGATIGTCLKNCTTATDCRSGTGNSAYTRCVPLSNGGGVCYR